MSEKLLTNVSRSGTPNLQVPGYTKGYRLVLVLAHNCWQNSALRLEC